MVAEVMQLLKDNLHAAKLVSPSWTTNIYICRVLGTSRADSRFGPRDAAETNSQIKDLNDCLSQVQRCVVLPTLVQLEACNFEADELHLSKHDFAQLVDWVPELRCSS